MNIKPLLKALFLSFLVSLSLVACHREPPARPIFPDITFANKAPIRLDVARIEVIDEYKPPLQAPNVEHTFPVSISRTVERWARDRLQPVGVNGVARVIIKDASAKETDLRRTPGIRGVFTTDQAQRYDARAEVVIQIQDVNRNGYADGSATRSRTVAENISLNQRERVFFEITDALVHDLDLTLERNISRFMPMFVR